LQKRFDDEVQAHAQSDKELKNQIKLVETLQQQLADLQKRFDDEVQAHTQSETKLFEAQAALHKFDLEKQALSAKIKQLEDKNSSSSRFNVMKESDLIYNEKENLLGEGQGGRVFRVRYNGADIAVKFIKPGEDEKQSEVEFLHEIAIMQHTPPHPNVVGFLGGSVSTRPQLLAIALMRGSLEKLLLVDKESWLDFVTARR